MMYKIGVNDGGIWFLGKTRGRPLELRVAADCFSRIQVY
jgi:hypothetical protein